MPRFSEYFKLGLTQAQLDFVDISTDYDTPVYVDPYAIEIHDDIWSANASEYIRTFFTEILEALRNHDMFRAESLMSHLGEPEETFLGVSQNKPRGKGVGSRQARQLISSILSSKAYSSGLLSDLSEMALYVEGIDRDKISDLTTNVIREVLIEYTGQQCDLLNIKMMRCPTPPSWDPIKRNWISKYADLPHIEQTPIMLVPKYIVRRKLSLDSQEFYNKQITDFLISEHIRANSSLVHTIRGRKKVFKKDIRDENPKSKSFISEIVHINPELIEIYKKIAKNNPSMMSIFNESDPTLTTVCASLAKSLGQIEKGSKDADRYHNIILASLTALFYPTLIQPHKEWPINDGRKRIDIVFTNSGDTGFFAQRRNDPNMNANTVIVECKNYSEDLKNQEIDQLLGRFDGNRGKFGIISCREIKNVPELENRLRDAAIRLQGYIICLTDSDIISMLDAKSKLEDEFIERLLFTKFKKLLE